MNSMLKKITYSFLFIIMLLSINTTVFATSTSSDITNENKIEEATKENNDKIATEIMMMNYITTKTEEIIRTKNRIILDDVIDMIDNGLALTKIDKKTQEYFKKLRDSIKDLILEESTRNRVEYIYSQKEANAMQAALAPNVATSILAAAISNVENPVASVLSVGALVLDRVSAYKSAITEADNQNLKEGWELDDKALDNIVKLKSDLFVYRADMVRENNIPEEMILYRDQVEEFEKRRVDNNHTARINFYENNLDNYKGFPLVYLELAKSYYDKKEYKKCVEAIDKYLDSNIDIFRCDKNLANVLPLGFAAGINYMSNSQYVEYANKLLAILRKIFKNDISNTLSELKFKYVIINMDLYKKTKKKEYLNEAYKQCYNNIEPLVKEQRKLVEAGNYEEINESLILNLESLFSFVEKLNLSDNDRMEINEILFGKEYKDLFYCSLLNDRYYYGKREDIVGSTVDELINDAVYQPSIVCLLNIISISINSALVTKDAKVTAIIKDNNKDVRIDLNYADAKDHLINFQSIEIDSDIFNNMTINFEIEPKKGVQCKTIYYNKELKDCSFILNSVGDKKVEDVKEQLINLGFSEDNIFTRKSRGIFEPDDGQIKDVYMSNFFYATWEDVIKNELGLKKIKFIIENPNLYFSTDNIYFYIIYR